MAYTTRYTLIKLAQEGNEGGWKEFFDIYSDMIRKIWLPRFHYNFPSENQKDEVIQRVMIRCFKNLKTFTIDSENQKIPFRLWLRRHFRWEISNIRHDYNRERLRHPVADQGNHPNNGPDDQDDEQLDDPGRNSNNNKKNDVYDHDIPDYRTIFFTPEEIEYIHDNALKYMESTLPGKTWEIFAKFHREHLNMTEIAEALGMDYNEVRRQVHDSDKWYHELVEGRLDEMPLNNSNNLNDEK